MTGAEKKKEKTVLEKHVQTILLSIITVAICWGSSQLFNLSIAVAEMRISVESLTQDRAAYVTKEYAAEREKSRDSQVSDLDKRVTRLENKMENLKSLQK